MSSSPITLVVTITFTSPTFGQVHTPTLVTYVNEMCDTLKNLYISPEV